MYGMMPSAKIVRRRRLSPLEHVLQQGRVDSRRRNVSAQAVHRQHAQREQNAVTQIRRAENIPNCQEQLVHCRTSTFPPAAVIFASADLLNACACTVNATFSSPLPRIFSASRFTRKTPRA